MKIFCRHLTFFCALTSIFLSAETVTPVLLENLKSKENPPTIINYGYNKFRISPYSKKNVVTSFGSQEGINFFERSKHKKVFFKLAPHYSPQWTITNCGISSAIIILNTIYADNKKTPPMSLYGSHYDSKNNTIYGQFVWTEQNFYTPKVIEKLDKAVVEGNKKVNNCYVLGVTLDQLTNTLQIQGLDAEATHVNEVTPESLEKFRTLIKSTTASASHYMIAHYSLGLYLEDEGGHFSPVGAYDEAGDSILILDTWSAANDWIWIKLEDLYRSMNTLDGSTYRGYILVKNELKQEPEKKTAEKS